jgi:hypothetical protein
MWISVLIQALLFVLTHAPELLASIQSLLAFFKAHRNRPEMSAWMTEFSQVLTKCEQSRNPRPLQEFLARISGSISGG